MSSASDHGELGTNQLQGQRRGPLWRSMMVSLTLVLGLGFVVLSSRQEQWTSEAWAFYAFFLTLIALSMWTGWIYWDQDHLQYRNGLIPRSRYNGEVAFSQLVSAQFEWTWRGIYPFHCLVLRTSMPGDVAAIRWESDWDTTGWGPLVIAAIDRNRGQVDPKFRELVEAQAGELDE